MPRAPTRSELKEKLDSIQTEIGKLQAQEALLIEMLDETPSPKSTKRAPKGSVKTRVLDLLEKVKYSGLNAAKAVEMTLPSGEPLDRGSVSSLLSRLKQDGVVVYDGSNYRLKKYCSMPNLTNTVTPIRTSGDGQF